MFDPLIPAVRENTHTHVYQIPDLLFTYTGKLYTFINIPPVLIIITYRGHVLRSLYIYLQ